MSGVHVVDKLRKTKALLRHERLKMYVPRTVKMSKSSLWSMLQQYSIVYAKPVRGTFGKGVMRAEQLDGGDSGYLLRRGTTSTRFPDFSSLYKGIQRVKLNRPYLVQQGIELLRYRRRRFDLRVMVQKNPSGRWETTGIIGRLAQPGKIVTNYHSGGKPMPVETLLKPHLSPAQTQEMVRFLNRFGTEVAHALGRSFPRLNTIGIDVALDRRLHPWILEVNTNPDPYIFKKLKDPRVFRKIYRYARKLGRV